MSILDKVKKYKQDFDRKKEMNQSLKLNKDLASSKREFARAKIKEEVVKNREYVAKIKAREREQRFAGLKGFGQKISERTAKRSKMKIRPSGQIGSNNNLFTQGSASSSGLNPVYFGGSKNSGGNMFTGSGGTNAIYHGLGNSPVQQKEKKKSIIIRL